METWVFMQILLKRQKKMIKIARQCCKEKERVGAFGGGLPWNLGLDPIPPSARYWGGGAGIILLGQREEDGVTKPSHSHS